MNKIHFVRDQMASQILDHAFDVAQNHINDVDF